MKPRMRWRGILIALVPSLSFWVALIVYLRQLAR